MSGTLPAGNAEDGRQNPPPPGRESSSEETVSSPRKKGKKAKGVKKKRKLSFERKEVIEDVSVDPTSDESVSLKNTKKSAAPIRRPSREGDDLSENLQKSESGSGLIEPPKETVVEIHGDSSEKDELEEVVVKKEDNTTTEDTAESNPVVGRDGKVDESKDREIATDVVNTTDQETADIEVDGKESSVRRRATLSDLRGDSVDKGDGEQSALSSSSGTEVRKYLLVS